MTFKSIKEWFAKPWTRFSIAAVIYVLWFGVWTGAWWSMLGLIVVYDIYITKYISRILGERNRRLCEQNSFYRSVYEWVSAIVFSVCVATLFHTYFFQLFVIPTSSMEKTLLVGDYLYVSKLAYGPKMPNTPLSFPLVHHTMPLSTTAKSFCEAIKLPFKRLAGFKEIKRGDVVVFNFPAGDTVLLENQSVTYYDVLRAYEDQYGKQGGRVELERDYTIISRPVDKRENYIKRLVAMPGDTLEVVDSQLFINGQPETSPEDKQYVYFVRTSSPFSDLTLKELGITEASGSSSFYQMPLTQKQRKQIERMPNVLAIEQYIAQGESVDVYPNDELFAANQDNMGKIWVPRKGESVELTTENLPLYRRIIDVYEDNDLRVEGDDIYINGARATDYTFKMNYYWLMGDNRHNSADSRFWGFVPEDHIVGKASFVWLSLDPEGTFPFNIRWDRLFKAIK